MESYETVLNYIRTTKTKNGLKVTAYLIEGHYEKGMTASQEQIEMLAISAHFVQPKRNYTLHPQRIKGCEFGEVSCQRTVNNLLTLQKPEVIFCVNPKKYIAEKYEDMCISEIRIFERL